MTIGWNLLLAGVGAVIVWKSSERLEAASEQIATHYGLPEIVKGAILTAIASSFPELSSVLLSTLVHGEFELGMSAIVGSAIFNILVIPACSVLFGGRMNANRELVFKEALFYLISVSVLLLSFSFAVIYFPEPGETMQGSMTRGLACIPIALYLVYIFIQYQDSKDHRGRSRKRSSHIVREWLILIGCMLIIAAGVELLVRAAINLGEAFHTPSFLWGLTIIAAGTSLPDLFISVKASRAGKDITSLANVLGSNTFDLLIAVPVGILIAGPTIINFARAAPMMGLLTIATIAMFVLMRLDMNLTKRDAVVLLLLYFGFVVLVLLDTIGLTSLLADTL